jgi:hypothetical protein
VSALPIEDGPPRHPQRDTVQPASHVVSPGQSSRSSCEDQKHGLKSVRCVVVVVEDASADAPHHVRMPTNDLAQGRLVSLADEAIKQEAIAVGGFARQMPNLS